MAVYALRESPPLPGAATNAVRETFAMSDLTSALIVPALLAAYTAW